MEHRLKQQLTFIDEANKLKEQIRNNFLFKDSQQENIAEHTWQSILLAQLFVEYAEGIAKLDLLHIVRMLTIHDLVTGFTSLTQQKSQTDGSLRFNQENQAAKKLFSMLPYDQGKQCYELWLEFENEKTVNARFASIIHFIKPMLTSETNPLKKLIPQEIFKTLLSNKKETRKIEERLQELLHET